MLAYILFYTAFIELCIALTIYILMTFYNFYKAIKAEKRAQQAQMEDDTPRPSSL